MANTSWATSEIRSAIKAYFQLLDKQQANEQVNKVEIYRALSKKHPSRSYKAFEYKFQNISAVLYEQKLPYADGLRPMGNYQAILKEHVMAHLKRTKQRRRPPIHILTGKLLRLRRRDFLPVQGIGSGRYGLTLEHYLSIPQNSSKAADFMGIEQKTKHDKGLQTLFSRVPSRYLACSDKAALVRRFGYEDRRNSRIALYTSFNNESDSLGFYMVPSAKRIVINKRHVSVLEYDGEALRDALLSKHNETAFITVTSKRLKNGKTACRFDQMLYCKTPSYARFLRLAGDGSVYLDFTLSLKAGKAKDHGFLWRVPQDVVAELYAESRLIDLTAKG